MKIDTALWQYQVFTQKPVLNHNIFQTSLIVDQGIFKFEKYLTCINGS